MGFGLRVSVVRWEVLYSSFCCAGYGIDEDREELVIYSVAGRLWVVDFGEASECGFLYIHADSYI